MHILKLSVVMIAFYVLQSIPAKAAYGDEKCFKILTKRAMLRKYDYKYYWGSSRTLSNSQENALKVTGKYSSQISTAAVDPGITTGDFKVFSLSMSSKKPCEYFSEIWAQREEFIATSGDDVLRDIARGHGRYIETLSVLSGCEEGVKSRLIDTARRNFDLLQRKQAEGEFSQTLDQIISGDQILHAGCSMS